MFQCSVRFPLLMTASLLAIAAPAVAQGEPSASKTADDQSAVDPAMIVVTGEKVVRSLQDTTTSVAVIDAKRIEQLNIVTLDDALRRVGNAGFMTTGSGRNEQFTLRGVQSSGVTPASTPVATLYIDDAPIPDEIYNASVSNGWDVQQFEILRGAQSTVQGRNSLIGAIIIRTREPSLDRWEGAARATYGNFNTSEISGAVGGPLVEDQVAIRIAAQRTETDGFVTRPDGSDGDARRTTMGRLKFRIQPPGGEGFRLSGSLTFVSDRDGSPLVDGDNPFARRQSTDVRAEIEREVFVGAFRADVDVTSNLLLTSLTTYSHGNTDDIADFDGLPDVGNAFATPRRDQQATYDDFTQELRLTLERPGLSAYAGAYYANRGSDTRTIAEVISPVIPIPLSAVAPLGLVYQQFGFPGVPAGAPDLLSGPTLFGPTFETRFAGQFVPRFRTLAAFAAADWDVSDTLRVHLALRYEEERARFGVTQQNQLLNPNIAAALAGTSPAMIGGIATAIAPGYSASNCPRIGLSLPACAGAIAQVGYRPILNAVLGSVLGPNFFNLTSQTSEQTSRALLPKFGVTVGLADDVSLSGTVQRAYRPGGQGINPVRARIFAYDSEYSWNYEVALRSQFFDRRLTVNLNAFLIDWRDQQLEVALSQAVQDTEVLNLGRSRLYGAEMSVDWAAGSGFTFFGSLGLLSTKVTEDDRTPEQLAGLPSLEGDRFPFAPSYSGSLGVDWREENGFNATADISFQGPAETLLPNSIRNDARKVVSIRGGWDNGQIGLFGFVSNLFQERYFVNAAAAGGSVIVGAPRTFGIGATARF
jgi:outer membrane receptor protein involved in Fe transport